jgi:hypothetical protein
MSPEIVCQIQHSAKFLIDIDNLSDESDDDEDEESGDTGPNQAI